MSVPTSPGGYLSPPDVADLLKIGVRAACNVMRAAGGFRLSGSWRVRADVLEAWLAQRAEVEKTRGSANAGAVGRALAAPIPIPAALLAQPATGLKPLRHTQPRRRKAAR